MVEVVNCKFCNPYKCGHQKGKIAMVRAVGKTAVVDILCVWGGRGED